MCIRDRKIARVSLDERISAIGETRNSKSQRELAKLFNCGKRQIQSMLTNHDRYVKEWEENCNKNVKKRMWQPSEEINKTVLEWFNYA